VVCLDQEGPTIHQETYAHSRTHPFRTLAAPKIPNRSDVQIGFGIYCTN